MPTTRPCTRQALDELIAKLDGVFNQVRRNAFDAFLLRGEKVGSELEDWFQAERALFALPESELSDAGRRTPRSRLAGTHRN